MAKPAVFLDSSVIIASLLSMTGGSFYIINGLKENFDFQTNEYGLSEIQKIFKTKFVDIPNLQSQLFLLFGTSAIAILANPSKYEIKKAEKYISKIDAPILASAVKHSDYLLTLDNEFFKSEILKFVQRKSLSILKPKEFIGKFRTQQL